MTRQRMFLDISCVEAARQRIRHVYDTFDTVCVQFSGGKDSSAVLYLAKEVHEERGLGPVKVIFRDEEMLSPALLDYVMRVRDYDWVDMEWYCLPIGTEIWVLGRRIIELLWSENRMQVKNLYREMPEWAITGYHFGLDHRRPLPEHIDYYTTQGKTGNIAFITGVRAAESMVRYRSVVQKLHESYIVTPYKSKKGLPVKFAKIIYDWQVDDVFKYLSEEHGAEYCEYYDLATLTNSNKRVGIPLHAVAIRRIGDVIATEPEFYDGLWECWPEIDAQRRWYPDFDIEKLIRETADGGWPAIREFIETYIWSDDIKRRAMSYAAEFRRKNAIDPYSYPMNWLVRNLLLNEITTASVAPVGPKTRAHTLRVAARKQEEEDFENGN